MSVPMKKRHTNNNSVYIVVRHKDQVYQFPKKVADQYKVPDKSALVDSDEVFAKINKKYTKPGALIKGLRVREELTQIEMAERLSVTQSDISQMENGTRRIGRKVAKRIEALFDVNYRSFLE